jgi:Uma2 family endonuclease
MLTIPRSIHFTPEEFAELCIANPDAVLELSAEGELEQMTPTSSETGERNADLIFQLSLWNRQTRLGRVFDSSTGFQLPNGAIRSPDAAWIANERWETLTPAARQGFAQICPDFVIELASPTDQIPRLRQKLEEYLANGARLGWLINPAERTVQVYRVGRESVVIDRPNRLSGEAVLAGFALDLTEIFDSA